MIQSKTHETLDVVRRHQRIDSMTRRELEELACDSSSLEWLWAGSCEDLRRTMAAVATEAQERYRCAVIRAYCA